MPPHRIEVLRTPAQAFDRPSEKVLGHTYSPLLARPWPKPLTRRSICSTASLPTMRTPTALLDAALRAAPRGVRVRLLVDDLNVGDHDLPLASLAQEPNIEVIAVMGGRNLGYAYCQRTTTLRILTCWRPDRW